VPANDDDEGGKRWSESTGRGDRRRTSGRTNPGTTSMAPHELEELSDAGAGDEPGESAQVQELRQELEYVNDRHLRLAAEFDNYRRRAQTQLAESGVRAQAELVGRLLDVLDDLRRVTTVDPGSASVESVLEGVSLLERKLLQTLEDAGLEELDPVGEPFDPNFMEALARSPTESEEEDDSVDSVFQLGFRFRGQLVRPARVSVRKYE
jgi:molecular chaperone GrpE